MSRYLIPWFVVLFLANLSAETVKLPVVADAGLSSERGHKYDNSGASISVPVRQNQNWSGFETKAYLMQFDTQAVQGWTVSKAWMNLYLPKGDLYGIGLCTVLADWDEGGGINGQIRRGGASWNLARGPQKREKVGDDNYWSWPESGIYSVSWAHPDARYQNVRLEEIVKKEIDKKGTLHLRFPIDPVLVESLSTGLAAGIVLTDDKGQVKEALTLRGDGRPYRTDNSNDTYVYTREIQDPALRPFLEVEGVASDNISPGMVEELAVVRTEPYDPSVTLSFTVPSEDGTTGGSVLGYDVRYGRTGVDELVWENLERVPLWAVPEPEQPGEKQEIRVFSPLPGTYYLGIRAVDEAGNLGALAQTRIKIPDIPDAKFTAGRERDITTGAKELVFEETLEVWACPDMCKVDPVSGDILMNTENYEPVGNYKMLNPVWSSSDGAVKLQAARGETVAFQLVLGRKAGKTLSSIQVSLDKLTGKNGIIKANDNIDMFRIWYLDVVSRKEELTGPWELIADKGHKAAWHGDACLPLEPPYETQFNLPTQDNMGDSQNWQSVWVDIYVPQKTRPGTYQATVKIGAEELEKTASIKLELEVLPFNLPDETTWPIELNGYSTSLGRFLGIDFENDRKRYIEAERRLYQLAHRHRCTINILPYSQTGTVLPGNAPELKGSGRKTKIDSWKLWEERFGPLLSGKAFTRGMGYTGPRQGVPISQIYMPFNEDWPVSIKEHYKDWQELTTRDEFAEWAKNNRSLDEAFDEEYQEGFSSVVSQMFRYFKKKGYTKTSFQFYFNNKYYYKVDFFGMRGGRKGTSFWLLDEPVDYDDYEANRFYLQLVKNGYEKANTPQVKIDYRTDVSQPELCRGLWDGLCNLWNSSGLMEFASTASFRLTRLPNEKYWRYSGETPIAGRLMNYQHNYLTVWALGGAAAMGSWNPFSAGDWFKPGNLSIIYQGKQFARTGRNFDGGFPGVRLKALRRTQQDMEYLNLLAGSKGWSRQRVRRAIATWADNPNVDNLKFWKLSGDRMFELRRAVANELSGSTD